MLVWKAMPSITPVMSAMRRELSEIALMVWTTPSTTSPPRTATLEAWLTSRSASLALLAFCCTVLVSCSIDAAVSSSDEACSSVRCDRSALPCAICEDAEAMLSQPSRTSLTMRARLSFMVLSAPIRSPVSSRVATWMSVVRSPAATWRAAVTACSSGRTMPRVTSQPSNMPTATPITARATMTARNVSYRSVPLCTVWAAAFSLVFAKVVMRSSSFCDEAITRASISATRGSAWVSGRAWAAAKKAADSRFQTCSVSVNCASARLPSSE